VKCPRCEKPVRLFTVDEEPVAVDVYPLMGTLDRRSVVTNEATETDPHPGGFVRHECQET
jgi:hypothetical protein